MMNYHQDNQETNFTPIVLAIGVFSVFFLFFFFLAPPLRSIHSAIWRAAQGWEQGALFVSRQEIQNENTALYERVSFLEQQNALLRNNSIMRFDSFASDNRIGVAAWVTNRFPYTFAQQWVLNQGAQSGIRIGDIAYAGDVVIGSVTASDEKNAEITPFFTLHNETQVIHTPSNMSLVVQGRGQGIYYAQVPRDFSIQEGDLIQWQGSPALAVIGYVENVIFDDRDALKKVFIALPKNPKKIQWLEIEVNTVQESEE